MNWLKSLLRAENRIDHKFDELIDEKLKKNFIVHTIDLPAYRFVDLMRAVNAVIEARHGVTKIETQQHEGLNQIIHDVDTHYDRTMRTSPKGVPTPLFNTSATERLRRGSAKAPEPPYPKWPKAPSKRARRPHTR